MPNQKKLNNHSHPAFSAVVLSLVLLLVLFLSAVSFFFVSPSSFKSSILSPLASFFLSGGARVEGTMRFLSTIFFGEEEEWYITPEGDASFRNLKAGTITASSITASSLTVDRLEAGTVEGAVSWENVTEKPVILSSLDEVSNNEGNIDLVASGNITITPNDSTDTITFTVPATAQGSGSSLNADLLDSLDSSQFLRSDTSDSFTSGTLTFVSGTTLAVQGSLSLPTGSITSDYILNGTIVGADLASNISISTSGNIETTGGGTITSAGLLAASSGISSGTILPLADDTYDLGSSSLRWRDLYLGPTSLHLSSLSSETTTARDWRLAIQETDGVSEGNLRILEGTSGTEALNVTPTGNIGIGTTNPQKALHVSSTNGQIRIQDSDSDGVAAGPFIEFYDQDSRIGWVGDGNSSLNTIDIAAETADGVVRIFAGTVGTERVRVESDGTVKIFNNLVPNASPTAGASSQTITQVDTNTDTGQYPSTVIGADGLPIIAYYDLAKVSSNIASIFKSTVLVQFAKDHADCIPYGKQAAQVLEDCEIGFSLPDFLVRSLQSTESIVAAMTHETIVAQHLHRAIVNSTYVNF